MSEMVERVSRAINPGGWAAVDDGYARPESRGRLMDDGRRAIKAMRNPTEAMFAATDHLTERTGDELEIYHAFIDAALK